jgi:hypothetical protein
VLTENDVKEKTNEQNHLKYHPSPSFMVCIQFRTGRISNIYGSHAFVFVLIIFFHVSTFTCKTGIRSNLETLVNLVHEQNNKKILLYYYIICYQKFIVDDD